MPTRRKPQPKADRREKTPKSNGSPKRPAQPRRKCTWRQRIGETAVLASLAAVVALASGIWAWRLAANEFQPSPRLYSPGTIVVAIQPSAGEVVDPVQISVRYDVADSDDHRGRILLAISQLPLADKRLGPPPKVYVLLCGAIASNPAFVDNRGEPIAWRKPRLDQGDIQFSTFGMASSCVYTSGELPPDGLRQMLLRGTTGAGLRSASADRILYVVPGVVAMPARVPIGDIEPGPLPKGSSAKIYLDEVPTDIENVAASPQLPDAGRLQWTYDFGDAVQEYRLAGDLGDRAAVGQRNLFLAGALVGVAGGALVWLLELTASATIRRIRRAPIHEEKPAEGDD